MPPPKEMPAPSDRGISRGPKIEVDADDKGFLHVPLHLKLKFKGFGGSAIDLAAFEATYMKEPAVNLTARLKPLLNRPASIFLMRDCRRANTSIRLSIKDVDGPVTTKIFKLNIAP